MRCLFNSWMTPSWSLGSWVRHTLIAVGDLRSIIDWGSVLIPVPDYKILSGLSTSIWTIFVSFYRVAVQTEEFSTLYLGDLEEGKLPASHDGCGSIEGIWTCPFEVHYNLLLDLRTIFSKWTKVSHKFRLDTVDQWDQSFSLVVWYPHRYTRSNYVSKYIVRTYRRSVDESGWWYVPHYT